MTTPPDFSVGQVLTAAQMNAVGLWRVTTCTVSSVGGTAATASNGVITIGNGNTSVTVSSAFSSDFDNYKIIVTGGGSNADANVTMALGASNTAYDHILMYASVNATTTPLATGNKNEAQWGRVGSAGANGIHVNIDLNSPNLAKYTTFSGGYQFPGNPSFPGQTNGIHQVATAYTSFTITCPGTSFTGGTIRVYGYRN